MTSMNVSLMMPRTFFRPWGVTRFNRPERERGEGGRGREGRGREREGGGEGGRGRGREGEREGGRERVFVWVAFLSFLLLRKLVCYIHVFPSAAVGFITWRFGDEKSTAT